MKKTLFSVAVLGIFAVLLGLTPQTAVDDSIQQLRDEVAQLGLRVSQLEHASGGPHTSPAAAMASGSSSSSAAPAPTRTMTLASVSQSNHPAGNDAEIARLQRKNASLMSSVDQEAVDQAQAAGQDLYAGREVEGVGGWGGGYEGSSIASTNIGAAGRQVLADQQLKDRYSTQAYITREKMHKLQAANAEPKQVIHGHDAKMIYTLETKRDLTDALNNIAIGDTVTWVGTRVDADETSESWIITSIHAVK